MKDAFETNALRSGLLWLLVLIVAGLLVSGCYSTDEDTATTSTTVDDTTTDTGTTTSTVESVVESLVSSGTVDETNAREIIDAIESQATDDTSEDTIEVLAEGLNTAMNNSTSTQERLNASVEVNIDSVSELLASASTERVLAALSFDELKDTLSQSVAAVSETVFEEDTIDDTVKTQLKATAQVLHETVKEIGDEEGVADLTRANLKKNAQTIAQTIEDTITEDITDEIVEDLKLISVGVHSAIKEDAEATTDQLVKSAKVIKNELENLPEGSAANKASVKKLAQTSQKKFKENPELAADDVSGYLDTPVEVASNATDNPCSTIAEDGTCRTFQMGKLSRSYYIYKPENLPENPGLLFVLHGLGDSIEFQVEMFNARQVAEDMGYVLVAPLAITLKGPLRPGKQAWNATSACCFFDQAFTNDPVPDDIELLERIIDIHAEEDSVNTQKVVLYGYSNGAFLSHRFACERSEKVSAIVTFAGVLRRDLDQCQPENPVSVLHIHGTADATISYVGQTLDRFVSGFFGLPGYYIPVTAPSAKNTALRWANLNQCDTLEPESTTVETLSINDNRVLEYDPSIGIQQISSRAVDRDGILQDYGTCSEGTKVNFVTIEGGTHSLVFNKDNLTTLVKDFLTNTDTQGFTPVEDEQDSDHDIVLDSDAAVTGLSAANLAKPVDTTAYGNAILTRDGNGQLAYEINLYDLDMSKVSSITLMQGTPAAPGDAVATLYPVEGVTIVQETVIFGTLNLSNEVLTANEERYIVVTTTDNPDGELAGTVAFGTSPVTIETTLANEETDGTVVGTAYTILTSPGHFTYSMTINSINGEVPSAETVNASMQKVAIIPVDGTIDDALVEWGPSPTGIPNEYDYVDDENTSFNQFLANDVFKFQDVEKDAAVVSIKLEGYNYIHTGQRGLYERLMANPGDYKVVVTTEAMPNGWLTGTFSLKE